MPSLRRSRFTSSMMYHMSTAVILCSVLSQVASFAPQQTSHSVSRAMYVYRQFVSPLPLQQNEYNDFSSREEGNQNEEEEARLLAQQFYQQVKLREQQREQKEQESSSARNGGIPSSPRPTSSKSSDSTETYTVSSSSVTNPKRTKFTGRPRELDSTGTPSAGLFARNNASVMAFPASPTSPSPRSPMSSSSSSSVKERMMQQEFNLLRVASNETILVLQMVGVLALLGFTVYIGLSGGITDGSDRFGDSVSEFNGGMELMEDLQRSSELMMKEGTSSSTMSSSSDVWL